MYVQQIFLDIFVKNITSIQNFCLCVWSLVWHPVEVASMVQWIALDSSGLHWTFEPMTSGSMPIIHPSKGCFTHIVHFRSLAAQFNMTNDDEMPIKPQPPIHPSDIQWVSTLPMSYPNHTTAVALLCEQWCQNAPPIPSHPTFSDNLKSQRCLNYLRFWE